MPIQLRQSLNFGIAYCPVGILVGILISFNAIGEGYEYFYIYSGVAAFFTATFFWWFLASKKELISYKLSAFIGFLSGSVSHYLCWYLIISFSYLSYRIQKLFGVSPLEESANLIEAFKISGMLSFFSLFFIGWLTVLLGILVAVLFNKYSKLHESKA